MAAAALAGTILLLRREPLPAPEQLRRLGLVALGVVLGFPLLSALALKHLPSSHAAVTVGLLPAAARRRSARSSWPSRC